jgi:glyoxylase I family protein
MQDMEPLGVHHVGLNVPDVPAAVAFYVEALGGRLRPDRPDFGVDGAWIEVGSAQIHLLEAPVPPGLGQHVALRVDDVTAAVDELRARGLTVGDPSPVAGSLQAFVSDPAGNLVELHEVRPV